MEDITVYYYVGKGRKTLTARIMRGKKRLCDRSTEIKVEGKFNNRTWFGKNTKANAALTKFQAEVNKKLEELAYHYKGNVPDDAVVRAINTSKNEALVDPGDQKLTLSAMAVTYKKRAEEGNMFSKRSGKRLSEATLRAYTYTSRLVERYLKTFGAENLDIDMYNLGTIPIHGKTLVTSKFERFVSTVKNFVIGEGHDDQTIYKNLYRIKTMIYFFAELHGIELGHLLKDLKWKKPKKEVVVLSPAQVEHVIRNFKKMYAECPTVRQREALQYWYVALILDPRRKDMDLWNRDNLYTKGDRTWIKYIPNKTKNSSGVTVDTMVPSTLLKMFRENIAKYGKLLPKLDHNLNLNIKRIARRYPETFGESIQILKRGAYMTVTMADYVHIHMMRGSGMTHKLENGWSETEVKEQSGHTYDSESFKRYVKISQERKKEVSMDYFKKMGI